MPQPDRPTFVLLVEPDPVIGLDLTDALEGAGYQVTGPIRSTAEAEAWLASWNPSLAVLDLADGAGARLALRLRARGVPVLIHAACADATALDPALTDAPWLTKPAWYRDVVDTVDQMAARAGRAG